MSLFDELNRRKVFRVAIGYVISAWVIAQVADLVADNFNAPDWVMQMIITLLIIGLPVSLLLSWAFDFTADGIRRTESGETEGSLVVSNKSVLALVAGIFVVLAVVFFVTWPRGDRSIAVLPFEDISPGGDQAYLGNGIADELRLELQRLDGLRVAGRTSSNAYAQEGGAEIGEKLNVETLLEGSVRKEGANVRITVQLTSAADGFTIWSESYNRELEKIFEMQEEIATEVAGRLGVSLGVGGVNAFRGAGTRNIDAYEAYLKAPIVGRPGRPGENEAAISLMERAIRLDPNYGAAWSNLALRVLHRTWGAEMSEAHQFVEQAHEFALRGAQLEPESAHTQATLALVEMSQFDWIASERRNVLAIELLADRPMAQGHALMLMRSGRMREAEKKFNAAVKLEPMDGRPHGQIWHVYLAQKLFAKAQEVAGWQHEIEVLYNNLDIALNKEDPEALKAAIRALPLTDVSFVRLYEPLLSALNSQEGSRSLLREIYGDPDSNWPRKLHDIAMAAAYIGDAEFALKVKIEEIRGNPSRIMSIWYPVMSDVRKLPAFKDFVNEINLVEYWRAYGWADACAPLGDNDFTCS